MYTSGGVGCSNKLLVTACSVLVHDRSTSVSITSTSALGATSVSVSTESTVAASLVGDLGVVSVLVGYVLHQLGPAVGQQYVVLALSHITLARLLVAELRSVLRSVYIILEFVVSRFLEQMKVHFSLDHIKLTIFNHAKMLQVSPKKTGLIMK